jgi:NAD(P)-dependent dehydrogenase (short-subunit alcohol dehydrogenase family)
MSVIPTTGVVLVTGGGRGIGAATARLAAKRGYAVCVNFTSAAGPAEALAAEIVKAGGRAFAHRADVAREDEVETLFAAVDRELGPVTALVNNAGLTGQISRLDAAEPVKLRRVVEVNVLGVLFCARAAVKRMSTRNGGAGGAIVNISSAASFLGSPGEYVWYAASKGAVDSFTIGLAKEVAGEGIRVNAVAPGMIATEIHASGGDAGRLERIGKTVPIGRYGEAEEIAEPVLWLMSEEARYITGEILRVTGGR